jgi:hypothetical protein
MRLIAFAVLLWVALPIAAQQAPPPPDWGPWAALEGSWIAEGPSAGLPGQSTSGGFTFEFQLDKRIFVRRNFAQYPSFRHDDLAVMTPKHATYWDNEGHIIDYAVESLDDGKTLRWVSAPATASPRFRFTYRKLAANRLAVVFEIAPPGQPEAFKVYTEATVRKKQ